ncbi:C40 family peptidase [Zymobacter sp. IVIA_12111.31 C1]|uniref:C40 family peptidase n=1 Tax=Zymobacter sp. IVIA_12111.31 C1 TaxID=3394854 RepID=UPI0039C1BD0A
MYKKVTGFCFLLLSLAGCAANGVDQPATSASTAPLRSSAAPYPIIGGYQTSGDNVDIEYTGRQHRPIGVHDTLMSEYREWAGTPYRFGGESRDGIDCSALTQRIFKERFNYALPRTAGEQMKQGRRVSRAALKPGDLVFFKPTRRLNHVGVYLGDGLFMHASSSQGVMISQLDNHYWARRYVQARRPIENPQLASRTSTPARIPTVNG